MFADKEEARLFHCQGLTLQAHARLLEIKELLHRSIELDPEQSTFPNNYGSLLEAPIQHVALGLIGHTLR